MDDWFDVALVIIVLVALGVIATVVAYPSLLSVS